MPTQAPDAGGLWRENYHSYGVQVPSQLYEFPDFPHRGKRSFCDSFGDACAQKYMTGAECQAYIKEYIKAFDLGGSLLLNTTVLKLERRSGGKAGWIFKLSTGASLEFDYAVIATGMVRSLFAY